MTSPAISKSLDPKGAFLHLSSELSADLQAFEIFFAGQQAAFEEEIHELVNYCLAHRGKRIRPLLVFLSGGRSGSSAPVNPQLVKAAAVVEMVHLATLIHDDILDEAELRHKTPTVFQKHGAEIAVLLGDAFFAHALHLASDFPTVEICRSVSLATRRVCAGEIEQNFHKGRKFLAMERYLRIIELKTAELFKVSCRLGGLVTGIQASCVEALEEFGRQLGISFQMYDDLLDLFGTEDKSGKTLGTDFASGKWTLPLILYAQTLAEEQRDQFVQQWAEGQWSLPQIRAVLQAQKIPAACRAVVSERLALARQQLEILQSEKLQSALSPLADAMDAQIAKLFES